MAKKKWNDKKLTPLMRQYWKIRDRHPGALLLFRMGDFYETFDEDARVASKVLGITLTKRANGKASDIDLAGFPHKALDQYLPKLVDHGLRVAICEQLEDPKTARKIVKRDVVEVVTPGIAFHDPLLSPKHSRYLAAVIWGTDKTTRGWAGLAYIDATTGEFGVAQGPVSQLEETLNTINPAELLFDKRQRGLVNELRNQAWCSSPQEDWVFGREFGYETLLKHFGTHSLKGFGIEDLPLAVTAAGAALYYLGETQKGRLPQIRRLFRYENDRFISLDPQTRRNLELVSSMNDGGKDGSLIDVLDMTQTPMGARKLRSWLVRPLRSSRHISERLDAVEGLVYDDRCRDELKVLLRQVGDLERLMARVSTGRASPRELIAVKNTLMQIPGIRETLSGHERPALKTIAERLSPCRNVVDMIAATLLEDPPAVWTDGGMIRDGFHAEVDELRAISKGGKGYLATLQRDEAERTGISSLKIGYNRVFGYYIEITHTHKEKVPEDYIRKQTLVNAERYITPGLKEYEEKILTAEEKVSGLEQELFFELREAVAQEAEIILQNASLLAALDCFLSLAEVAVRYHYVRPQIEEDRVIHIEDGRHPVVERLLPPGEPFIPNSVHLDGDEEQIIIITGPNMAGKSVVLRQVGLIVLLAQVGSFVPAKTARIGLVDKIFTRVGASDNLAAGESTFLVEMNETASILNNASPRSLILLDEVGRGTSTFDGLSIAWAIVEYLHENEERAARTLFATHYHELNGLEQRYPRIRNFRVQVQEHEGRVIFLRTLVPGGADSSYGIEVARMAGLPAAVVQRAQEVLGNLEAQRLDGDAKTDGTPVAPRTSVQNVPEKAFQMSLFGEPADPVAAELKETLRGLDVNQMTPIQALMKLASLQERADEPSR